MQEPLFDSYALATLGEVESTFTQRGTEYGDTWRNAQFLNMRAVAKALGASIPEDALRAIACAAFCDMKYQRMEGGYKKDNIIDGIAYYAVLAKEVEAVQENRKLHKQAESAAQVVNGNGAAPKPCSHNYVHFGNRDGTVICGGCGQRRTDSPCNASSTM